MRLCVSWMVAVVLAFPRPGLAQVLTPADLIGTWGMRLDGKIWADSLRGQLLIDMLTFNADGSYTRETKRKEGDSLVTWRKPDDDSWSRWKLTGDTLDLGRNNRFSNGFSRKVLLKDRRLFLWDWYTWNEGRRDEKCAEQAFERFEQSTPLTLPPPPRITIRSADLVGTWAGKFVNPVYGSITDTLVIGADHTLRSVHVGPADNAHEKGTWDLLPGDVLTGPLGNVAEMKIYLQNEELVRCSGNYPILKRVGP